MDRAGEHRKSRRARDRAMVLLIVGVLLLMPPLAGIFQLEAKIFGLPATLVYLFAVWLALIIGTARISRDLTASEESTDDPT